MSTHLNFYHIDFNRFISVIGSKDESVAERAIQIAGSRLRRYHALNDNLTVCKEIIRQIVFEGKIPTQIGDLPNLRFDDYKHDFLASISFEVSQSLMSLLNIIGDDNECQWIRYGDFCEVYGSTLQIGLSKEQKQVWYFLSGGRALHNEVFSNIGYRYGYLLNEEIGLLLESMQPLLSSLGKKRSFVSFSNKPDLTNVIEQFYTILENCVGGDAFFDII